MTIADTNPSNNGRGSDAWHRSWTHFRVDRRSLGYCRVTFDHPPINTITATTVAELAVQIMSNTPLTGATHGVDAGQHLIT